MRILADTNAFLWFITDSPRLSAKAKGLLESAEDERLLSMATVWEIAIKHSLGKLVLQKPLDQLLPEQLAVNRFVLLSILTSFSDRRGV